VPHQPATPAVRYQSLFADVTAPRTPSFNEADASDKPAWVSQARLSETLTSAFDPFYRRRLQATASLQDVVFRTIRALVETKQLDNTYVFFTSDNGFHIGQHRLAPGKQTAYEEDIRVPFMVRGPGVPQGATLPHMILNTDLASTFGDLARARYAERVDGRSLVPLLGPNPLPREEWRHAILVEHEPAAIVTAARPTPTRPPAGFEPLDPQDQAGITRMIPAYRAIRTERYAFVEYDTSEKELYDIERDPHQVQSIHLSADPALLTRLSKMLDDLRRCSGRACLAAENATP
jgi:arylsulfatase A-like enzyme